ncbi:MaoC family dehydratase [soil metagenome]
MTTHLEAPSDLLAQVGRSLGTTDWLHLTQEQVVLFAELTRDRQWIHIDPGRAAEGPYGTAIVQGFLTLALAPGIIGDVLRISDPTTVLTLGLNKVRFHNPLRVGERVRVTVVVMRAQQTISGVEVVFTLSYETDGGTSPACVADVMVLYP